MTPDAKRSDAVASVEYLPDAAPVYNLEIAGEHVYEITDLALLVHNADWDCGEFLRLRRKLANNNYNLEKLSKAEQTTYNALLKMVQKDYESQLGAAAVATLISQAPKSLLKSGWHLHHILPKIGGMKFYNRILAFQEILWDTHKIDPFMSIHIFVIAPKTGVHKHTAIETVIEKLENFFFDAKGKRIPLEDDDVTEFLKRIGQLAQSGKL